MFKDSLKTVLQGCPWFKAFSYTGRTSTAKQSHSHEPSSAMHAQLPRKLKKFMAAASSYVKCTADCKHTSTSSSCSHACKTAGVMAYILPRRHAISVQRLCMRHTWRRPCAGRATLQHASRPASTYCCCSLISTTQRSFKTQLQAATQPCLLTQTRPGLSSCS